MPTIRANSAFLATVALGLLCVGLATAQNPSTPQSSQPAPSAPSDAQEGKDIGGFHVMQSIELGGRITNVTGSQPMYDTLVDLQTGARILDQSLTMQSINHHDVFDTLTVNSFGWGGDPEQALRMRVSKYNWYNFSASYQHMQNYFDYDLFVNPLNPSANANPYLPILTSPHAYYDRQNLYNYDLVVLPMHRLSFRVDYSRNRITGPSFSSVHQGTDALTSNNWDTTLNSYRFGADFRVNKQTTLSYTQMLQYYDGGSTYALDPFNSWPLSNGNLVSFGLPWYNGGSPCTTPQTNGIANPTCNGYFNYGLYQHLNTSIPTEQLNLKSSSLKWLDFNGQYQYSHASMNTPLYESYYGLTSRTNELGYTTPGSSSKARWNSSSADVSATIHINDQLRFVEAFRFRNYSVAGDFFDQEQASFTAASLGSATLLKPIATFPPTILTHSTSSPADVTNEITSNMTGQRTFQNDFQLQYDVSQFFGVRVGFNWKNYLIQPGDTFEAALGDVYYPNNPNRGNCAGHPLNPDGSCTFVGVLTPWGSPTTEINRFSGLLGVWYRQGALRANANVEIGGADNWIYRIDPTTFFNVTGSVSYTPRPWLMVGGNVVFQQAQNNSGDIQYNQHNYLAMATASIMPGKRWGLDLAYNFDAIQQNSILCFQSTAPPAGSVPCYGDSSLLQTYGIYQTHTQYGYFAFTLTPIQRVNIRLGYNIVDNQGTTTNFNALLPLGPLASTYQTPLAAVDVLVHKNVTFKAGWNYYQYAENDFVGPTAPRYFHANNATLALRYAF
ncbi:MAG TPA: hypothetical protein VMT56_03710 [Candidatus Bathyarchaeia archaeon]|nr:hypothetical protein [Candidatus Bathyarchaeia archaeon]